MLQSRLIRLRSQRRPEAGVEAGSWDHASRTQ